MSQNPDPTVFVALVFAAIVAVVFIACLLSLFGHEDVQETEATTEDLVREIRELKRRRALDKGGS